MYFGRFKYFFVNFKQATFNFLYQRNCFVILDRNQITRKTPELTPYFTCIGAIAFEPRGI